MHTYLKYIYIYTYFHFELRSDPEPDLIFFFQIRGKKILIVLHHEKT